MENGYIKKLVVTRLMAMPPDISFSIGNYGDFSRDQLIDEVHKNSLVGKATIDLELSFLRGLPGLSEKLVSHE